MATFRKRGKTWRVEVYVRGKRESASFPTKQQAAHWALEREAQLKGGKLPSKTLRDAMQAYADTVAPTHRGERWERVRLDLLGRHAVADVQLQAITDADLRAWRDHRLQTVGPASVAREMTLLRSVLEHARVELGWIRVNPMTGVKRPRQPPPRRRRISQDEIDRVTLALGLDVMRADTTTQRTALAFLFSLETAMRSGEVLGLRWDDLTDKTARLPRTKNGDAREVPLSPAAREIISALPRDAPTVFDVRPASRDAIFRAAVRAAGISDLHFHDSRAEAIWRLSKKLDVLELARVIGHRDINSLMMYYETSAADLADRL